jgi:hypothetical protein
MIRRGAFAVASEPDRPKQHPNAACAEAGRPWPKSRFRLCRRKQRLRRNGATLSEESPPPWQTSQPAPKQRQHAAGAETVRPCPKSRLRQGKRASPHPSSAPPRLAQKRCDIVRRIAPAFASEPRHWTARQRALDPSRTRPSASSQHGASRSISMTRLAPACHRPPPERGSAAGSGPAPKPQRARARRTDATR